MILPLLTVNALLSRVHYFHVLDFKEFLSTLTTAVPALLKENSKVQACFSAVSLCYCY